MTKKDISKILTTGSPKQRMLLIAEEIARGKCFKEKLLTEREFEQLAKSFKKPSEIRLWNEFRKLDDTVTNAIVNLQGKMFDVLMNYSNLRGYILVWNTIENAELLVNSVLHAIKDPKERKQIAEDAAKGIYMLFSRVEPNQDGYIEIKVDGYKDKPRKKEYSLWYVMNNVKKEVETSVKKYISWEKAILDFMAERGFNVKTYKEQIKQMTNKVYRPIIGWAKYSGKLDTNLHNSRNPRMEKIIKKYTICPNIDELKVDEEEYNWFRRYFLDGEDYPIELVGINGSLSYEQGE